MKNRILKAATQEISKYGAKFTIDGVVSELRISKKTLYQYYHSKEELVAAVTDEAMADIFAQEQEILSSGMDIVSKIKELVIMEPRIFNSNDWLQDDIRKYYPQEWLKIEELHRRSMNMLVELMEEGIREELFRPVNTKIAVKMLINMCIEFMQYRFLLENNLTLKEALQSSVDIFLYGVCKDGTKPQHNTISQNKQVGFQE